MIVHIYTIKMCGMVNDCKFENNLNFCSGKIISQKRRGYLKCLRGFRGGGVSQMSMFVYKGESGGQKCPEFCLHGLYSTQSLDESFEEENLNHGCVVCKSTF